MCCTQHTENIGGKNDTKICDLRTIAHLCRAVFLQQKHVSKIGKKITKQQYLPHMPLQYGELWPTSSWDPFVSLGTPANFNEFRMLAA